MGAAKQLHAGYSAWRSAGSVLGERFSNPAERAGRENAKQFLRDNPTITAEIEFTIRQSAGILSDVLSASLADAEGEAGAAA